MFDILSIQINIIINKSNVNHHQQWKSSLRNSNNFKKNKKKVLKVEKEIIRIFRRQEKIDKN